MNADSSSKFVIHEACREGNTALVESLLNGNPRLATRRDDDDRLPLHWAVAYNRLPIVETLAQTKGFDVDAQEASGWTPLMMAASLKDAEALVNFLIGKDADINAKNNNGQTALHFTSSKSNLDTAKLLISRGASARIRDKRGQYAIHRAAAVGSVPILKLLISSKSPLDATDIDGCTALHHAISEGHGDAALELLKAGCDTEKRDGNDKLAIELAPDSKVRNFILQSAEREGIDLV